MDLKYELILEEIEGALKTSLLSESHNFISKIVQSRLVLSFGAGRVGLAMQGFSKRLRHLGLDSYYLDDTAVPATGPGDTLVIGSGSGNTPSVFTMSEVAVKAGLDLILITANPESKIASLASSVLVINAPTKDIELRSKNSIQPMTTLFEQALSILLDSLVLEMMGLLNESNETMTLRHNVIE